LHSARPTMTLVNRGEEVSLWDHNSLTYWSSPIRIPPMTVPHVASSILRWHSGGDGHRVRVALRDSSFGAVRLELEFTSNPDWNAFATPILSLTFGGRACHCASTLPIEELATNGFLLGAKAFIADSSTPVMSLRVENPSVLDAGDADFAPPADYKNGLLIGGGALGASPHSSSRASSRTRRQE
jgi:hypothetical protein